MTDNDLSDKEMIEWLRQPEDVRVCLSHEINMCRVKPSPRELYAAERMEKMLARIAELEASNRDTPDFPALVELASRLEGKDRKTCELALYTLKKQDERLAKKDEIIKGLKDDCEHHRVIKEAAIKRGHEQSARIARLEAALRPFSDEAGVGPMPGQPDDPRHCNMKFLRAAREAYLGTE